MRTNILNKMINAEIEAYLDAGGDAIFIGVGTCETHGAMPVDCEAIFAEAMAVRLAEKVNALALINLPFTYAGATAVGRGTIGLQIQDGYLYLKQIAHSLLRQGFRKQIYVSGHGPASLTLNSMISDFFEETKCPLLHLDAVQALLDAAKHGYDDSHFNDMVYGAYKIMHQEEYLYIDEQGTLDLSTDPGKSSGFADKLGVLSNAPGNYPFYYRDSNEHAFEKPLRSIADRDAHIEAGLDAIDRLIEVLNPQEYLDTLARLDQVTNQEIRVKYPHLFK